MRMNTTLQRDIGSAISNVLGNYAYVFITSDTRSIDAINSAVGGDGTTPSNAGLASMTGNNGSALDTLTVGSPVVGTASVTVTCSLQNPMVVSAAGTATYLVLCSGSNMTGGTVGAVIPIGKSGTPITMDNPALSVGDKIKLPALTFTVPVS